MPRNLSNEESASGSSNNNNNNNNNVATNPSNIESNNGFTDLEAELDSFAPKANPIFDNTQIMLQDSRLLVRNDGANATVFEANASNLTSSIVLRPSGVANTGLEVHANGAEGDPNANRIYLQENTFMPASADLYLADLGSLRETLNTLVSYAVAPPWQLLTSVTFAGATTNWVTGSNLVIDGFNSWQPASVIIHSYIDSNGDPVYRCQLRGQIRSSLNPAVFAASANLLTIPAALRPLKSQFHIVRAQVGADTIGSIQILSTNGAVNVIDVDTNVEGHLHLEGIVWYTN